MNERMNWAAMVLSFARDFETLECPKTAKELLTIAKEIKKGEVITSHLDRLPSLFDLLEEEFLDLLPIGKKYRKQCFREISIVFAKVIPMLEGRYVDAFQMVVFPIRRRLERAKRNLGPVFLLQKRLLEAEGSEVNRSLTFHLYAYTYLCIVEGIFDELARLFFFLLTISKERILSLAELDRMTVRDVVKELRTRPVFLYNWDVKWHMRNAIGHARVSYDPKSDTARFVDVNPRNGKENYDKTHSRKDLIYVHQEVFDTLLAFEFTLKLLVTCIALIEGTRSNT